jgi:extracellular elastinolytic metalloproteinase
VWCSALWQVFGQLVLRHGHTHAERRMLRYVIGGLELTPNQPTFLQARDAIISAVSAIDGTDLRPVWRGFAQRGMGTGAITPPSGSDELTGIVESFKIPQDLPDDPVIAVLCAVDQLL